MDKLGVWDKYKNRKALEKKKKKTGAQPLLRERAPIFLDLQCQESEGEQSLPPNKNRGTKIKSEWETLSLNS